MLDHPRRDPRQLLDLMTRRLTSRQQLTLTEHMTALTRGRPMLDHLIDSPRRQQLTTVPLMPRLPALLATRPALARRRPLRPVPLGGCDEFREFFRNSRSSRSTRPSAARSDDPSATAPQPRPHAPRRRSPRPQPAPHPNIRQSEVMSPRPTERLHFASDFQDFCLVSPAVQYRFTRERSLVRAQPCPSKTGSHPRDVASNLPSVGCWG